VSNSIAGCGRRVSILHTVGDYPSYDLELSPEWISRILSLWNSQQKKRADPIETLVALRFRAEFDGLPDGQPRWKPGDGPLPDEADVRHLSDLVRVAGPWLVANQLEDVCRNSANANGRIQACLATAEYFPGRCQAYNLALKGMPEKEGGLIAGALSDCDANIGDLISNIRSDAVFLRWFFGWNLALEHRRETMRVYASAMDERVHSAACEVAARIPEAHDIPECLAR
jgi:hypothetical protein